MRWVIVVVGHKSAGNENDFLRATVSCADWDHVVKSDKVNNNHVINV